MQCILGKDATRHVTVSLVYRVKMEMVIVRMQNVKRDGFHEHVTNVSTCY
jgi:ribosomal protein S8